MEEQELVEYGKWLSEVEYTLLPHLHMVEINNADVLARYPSFPWPWNLKLRKAEKQEIKRCIFRGEEIIKEMQRRHDDNCKKVH